MQLILLKLIGVGHFIYGKIRLQSTSSVHGLLVLKLSDKSGSKIYAGSFYGEN